MFNGILLKLVLFKLVISLKDSDFNKGFRKIFYILNVNLLDFKFNFIFNVIPVFKILSKNNTIRTVKTKNVNAVKMNGNYLLKISISYTILFLVKPYVITIP